jgi:glycosyltransferase 2 family protein
MPKKGAPLLRLAGYLVTGLSLLYIFIQLARAWPDLQGISLRPVPTMFALLCGAGSFLLYALLWREALQQMGVTLHRSSAVYIWFVSQLARYVPGKVWHLVGRLYLTRHAGINAHPVSVSILLEMLQLVTSGLTVAALSLLFWEQAEIAQWALLALPLLFLYGWPQLLHQPLQWAGRVMGYAAPDLTLRRDHLFALLPGYGLSWLIYGVGLYLLTLSLYPLPLSQLPILIGIFAFSWVAGFMSVITPMGLGVREGVMGHLLSLIMPLPIALLLALLARIWITVAELAVTALIVVQQRWLASTADSP